jgi:hypothetical protein
MNRWCLLVFHSLMLLLLIQSGCFAADVLEGDCVPTKDPDKTWDCKAKLDDPSNFRLEVACTQVVPSELDKEWFIQGGFSQTNKFVLRKFNELGLRGFTQWTACQGLHTALDVHMGRDSKGSVVHSLTVDIYGSRDRRLRSITENWPWWCAEGGGAALISDYFFGCFVPSYYELIMTFDKNGEVSASSFGSSFDY